ncbi:uncharacterized protein LOC124169634 isoform X2 [Ischnura elegans]|uniref:uncharacterized protein LOC124169634 isoform X2 n=1 Tax=Ischnura elegans TaxID=197161 RepID=UPI001ED87E2A|nr:uncharacterized protein LOC124169634 isoform X2 [Ischnura elegans]
MVKKKGPAWDFFYEKDKGVQCKFCSKEYKHSNVNKMTRHIVKCFECPSNLKDILNVKLNNMILKKAQFTTPKRKMTAQEQNDVEDDGSFVSDPGPSSSNSQRPSSSLSTTYSPERYGSHGNEGSVFIRPSSSTSTNGGVDLLPYNDQMDSHSNMAFYPFAMPPNESMEAMHNFFREAQQFVQPFMAMGMAQAQGQPQCGRFGQRPNFHHQTQSRASSNSHHEDDDFHIEIDVHDFAAGEISVKKVDNKIVVEGNHDARESGGITAARHFLHRYTLPDGVKHDEIKSSLSSDGILTVSAPKNHTQKPAEELIIPITPTGMPAKKQDCGEPSTSKNDNEPKENM